MENTLTHKWLWQAGLKFTQFNALSYLTGVPKVKGIGFL
jgi:hypothetical protein